MIARLIESSGWLLFVLFSLVFWIFGFAKDEFLTTNQLFDEYIEAQRQEKYESDYNDLASEFEDDIEDYDEKGEDYYWSDLLFDLGINLIYHVLLFTIISACIYVGLSSVPDLEGILYKPIFKVVVIAEFVFFIPMLIKFIWFSAIDLDYDYLTVRNYYPLSLLSLFDVNNVSDWLIYPLRKLNIFEIIYGYILVIGIGTSLKISLEKVAKPVVLSYSILALLFITIRVYLSTVF